VNSNIIHALDGSAGKLVAVCRSRVTVTSQVSKDGDKVTCELCRERLQCPGCGWPIAANTPAVLAAGRRYHAACAVKLELDAPPPTPAH